MTSDRAAALKVIAACDGCGRGFCYIHHEGVACFCRAGSVWLLPEPEPNSQETDAVRSRRRDIVAARESYKADMDSSHDA